MATVVGPAGAVGALALTAGLAVDAGGYGALSWDRALVAVLAVVLVVLLLAGGERPGRHAALLLGALAALTAWTAASWFWSDSPPAALEEAQRVALYLAVVAAVVLAGRRVPPAWVAAGVVGGVTVVAVWNLVTLARGVAHPHETGSQAQPVGYGNGLALLCVLGLLLLPLLPRPAWLLAAPLAADLALQQSTGALAALAAGALVHLARRSRAAVAVLVVAGVVATPFAFRGHERANYWRVAVAEARANPALGSGAGTFADWWLRKRTVTLSTQEAHSLYLETLAELGPLGLALVLVALAAPLVAARRRPALAAPLVAYDVGAAVDFHWELAGVTVPMLLVAAAAVAQPSRRARVRLRLAVPAAAVLAAAAILAYAGNAPLARAHDDATHGAFAAAAANARRALRFMPFASEPWEVLGDVETERRDRVRAYRRGLECDANDWSLWSRLATVSKGELRRLAEAKAAQLNPLAGASGS